MRSALLAFILALFSTSAAGHATHQHGVAKLEVTIAGTELKLRLDTPLDNLLGFEHAPRTAAQRAAAQRLLERLRQGDELFQPTLAAACRMQRVEITAPVLQGAASVKDHADLQAEWHFACAELKRLTGLRVNLFADFPRLKRLDAAVAGPHGQSSKRLTTRMPDLAW